VNASPLQLLVCLYFVVSIIGSLGFSRVIERRATALGETVPLMLSGLPGVVEDAHDRAMRAQGRLGRARIWGALLMVNALLAAGAFYTLVVRPLQQAHEQEPSRRR
jgi:hypothetical protein